MLDGISPASPEERGFTGANPDTKQMVVEVDYLVGDNLQKVVEIMKGL